MANNILNDEEISYFKELFSNFGITYLSVKEDGIDFKEDEISNFLRPDDPPSLGLDKLLRLRRVTNKIKERIKFNYSVTCEEQDNNINISIKFHE